MILNDFYAVDETFVYSINDVRTAWVKMPTADRTNFTVIRGQFARDADQIFYRGKKVQGADIKTFSILSESHGYSQDDTHVFGPEGIIDGADKDTFKVITGVYALDAGHVYAHAKMMDADSGTFRVIKDSLYAVDNAKVFYDGQLLPGISPNKFVVK